LKKYQVIPENTMIEMNNETGGNNAFGRLLSVGNEFKAAEVEPIYLLDGDNMEIIVVSKDYINKKLH